MRFASKSWTIIWLFVAGLIVMSCLQDDVEHVDAMDIQADSALLSLHTVKITLLDSNQNELQVLYNDSIVSLSDLSRLRLTTPYRGRASIRIEGWKDSKPAYLEIRGFDLASQNLLDVKVVFHPAAGISRPPVLSGLPASAEVKAGDSLKVSATAMDIDGPLNSYSWTFTGGLTPDISGGLTDSSANITGSHVYTVAGEYLAILAVSDSMSTVRDTVVVSVKAKDGSPPLEADAGADATVGTDSLVRLTPKAKGGSGPVAGYAWKSGDGEFSAASLPGDTSFTMPSQPGTFTVLLKATDSSGQIDLDSVVFTVIASANANLAVLKIGGAELDPLFKPATELYTASVPFGISKINMGAITQHKAATIKLGSRYIGAADSAEVSLAVGDNTIEAVVLSQSGVQKKYQVTVTRRKNTETRLAGLEVSVGTLSPKFHPDTSEYTIAVTNEVASVNLKALAMDSTGATLRLAPEGSDTVPLLARTPSSPQALEVGTRAFQVWVIAQDGAARRSYRVAITRQASPNATLLSLVPSVGTLKPSFLPNVSEYFDTVSNAQAGLLLRAVPTSDKAKLYQAGSEVAPGADGPVATLPVGDTTMSILVRAETGDTNTYRVRVHRKSTDATLKGLTTSVPGLPNGFATGTESYSDTVGADVASLTVTPVPNHQQAKAQVASPVTLKDGANPIAVTVIAEDGNTLTYTMNVYRISGNARLATVEASAGDWGTLFKPDVFSYKDTVPESVGKVSIRATLASGKSKIQIQGKAVASGAWSDSVTLVEGMQTLKVKVVAESGDSVEYTLALYRTSANARLKSLAFSPGEISPMFSQNTLLYSDTLDWKDSSVTLTGTLGNDKSNIIRIGSSTLKAKSINEGIVVKEGHDTLEIAVQSEEGNLQIYRIGFFRKFHPASLSSLWVSKGIVKPNFSHNHMTYTDSLLYKESSMQIEAICMYSDCIIKLENWGSKSGSMNIPIGVIVGDTSFDFQISSPSGFSRTYTLKNSRPRGFVKNFASGKNFKGGIQTSDGGYTVIGEISNGSRLDDAYLIKTNFAGDSLWSKAYGSPFSDWVTTMRPTKDKGVVVLAKVRGAKQLLITRTDVAHDPIWTKTLAEEAGIYEEGKDITATSDGGFVILATVRLQSSKDSIVLIKLNSDGSPLWRKGHNLSKTNRGTNAQSILEMPDGSLVIAGTTQIDTGCAYGMLLKTDANGDMLWFKTYPNQIPGQYDFLRSVSFASDGGFILAGSGGNSGSIVRTDKDGVETWIKYFGVGQWNSFNSIQQTKDGGFIATGYCTTPTGGGDIYVVKVTSSGIEEWSKTFGGPNPDEGYTVQQTSDGGYMVFGKPPFTMIKLDKSGNSN